VRISAGVAGPHVSAALVISYTSGSAAIVMLLWSRAGTTMYSASAIANRTIRVKDRLHLAWSASGPCPCAAPWQPIMTAGHAQPQQAYAHRDGRAAFGLPV
jgi:hypothetical protein